MGIRKRSVLGVMVVCHALLFHALLFRAQPAVASVDDISVVEVVEVSSSSRGRTAYYTYHLRIVNNGVPLTGVSAVVSSIDARATRVTERSLSFGDLGTNVELQSSDTFTIRVSAQSAPNLDDLVYTFSGEEVIIDDDTVAPNIIANLSTPANANGWHNAPVNISFVCSDNVAIASCTNDILVALDGANQSFIGTAVDTSGNATSINVIVNLDSQAPLVDASLSENTDTPPNDNATLLQKVSIATLTEANTQMAAFAVIDGDNTLLQNYSSDEDGEGLVDNISLPVGVSEFLINATDAAGNQGEALVSVERLQCQSDPLSQRFYIESSLPDNASLSQLSPTMDAFDGVYHQFTGDAQGLISVVPAYINEDVLIDWVMVSADSADVSVVINDGSGVFKGATTITTGFETPVAVVVSDLVETEALDLAVAHSDGTIAIFAGAGDGSFSQQASELFVSSSPIVDLSAGDFNQDGYQDLLILSATQLELLTRNNDQTISSLIVNGDFLNGLAGWMVNAVGHGDAGTAGVVNKSAGGAQLFENGSFLVSLFQSFTPSSDFGQLEFSLSSIFLEESAGAIPDVLEVSLLNASNQSLVPTFHPNATSFLNIAADGTVSAASGVSYSNGQVTVDISSVTEEAFLYFDLLGHPPSEGSSFVVSNVNAGETMLIDNSYSSTIISSDLGDANGLVYCDAVNNAPPILVSDPGAQQVVIFTADENFVFTPTATLAQGGQ